MSPEPKGSASVTDWLEDLEVLPTDMVAPKQDSKEVPHAHLQMVQDGEERKLQVVLDPDPDLRFPEPVERQPEPVQQKQDSGWFMEPDNGTKPRAMTERVPRPDPAPAAVPEKPRKGGRDHLIHRAHGLEWQKEEQLKFEADDGYSGPESIRHEEVTKDGTVWNIPSGKKVRRDDR